jgi:hypothetical protein
MKRDYEGETASGVTFFVGTEVEKTPALGMRTLFVTGLQDVNEIRAIADEEECTHIFFGANHSFKIDSDDDWFEWDEMIKTFLKQDFLCSLDIDVTLAEDFLESELVEYNNFIPQIRIPLPYVKQWNYNTMIKIDDRDFNATNPGVWCHSLHGLLGREKFTDWNKYSLDKIVK